MAVSTPKSSSPAPSKEQPKEEFCPICHLSDSCDEESKIEENESEKELEIETTNSDNIQSKILCPIDIHVSFENFPYYLSESTKKSLISAAYINFMCPLLAKQTSDLATVSPRILLSGPSGSASYQESLVKALASYFGVRLLVIDARSLVNKEKKKEANDNLEEILDEILKVDDSYSRNREIKDLFEVSSSESENEPFIVYLKEVEDFVLNKKEECRVFKEELENLLGNIVVIAQNTVEEEENSHLGRSLLRCLRVVHMDDIDSSDTETPELIPESIHKLFPNEVTIELPRDEALLEALKKQFESDNLTVKRNSNFACIRTILDLHNLDCFELETLCITGEELTRENAEKIVGWALSHQLTSLPESYNGETKVVISGESMKYGIDSLKNSLPKEKKSSKKSLKDVVTENKFEQTLLNDVIPPNEIGVSFDDIGALEKVKETLMEMVMLPLQRPELFCKGQLAKPSKGILLFGPPGTGKTMLAKAVATEAGANFINISASSIMSKWFGEGEKYVKAIFSLASKIEPCVIFVDEVDSMLGRRENPSEH